MLNRNDELFAQERYADLRRYAEQHNAATRFLGRSRSYDGEGRGAVPVWRWMRKVLRPGAAVHNQTAVDLH